MPLIGIIFILAIPAMIVYITCLGFYVHADIGILEWLSITAKSFIRAQNYSTYPSDVVQAFSILSLSLGIFHLAIFFSFLYSLISRR